MRAGFPRPGSVGPSARPGLDPFRKARSFEVHVSGGEYNVAANLSDCFGLQTGIATAMVNYGIGELVQARVRETGVTPFYNGSSTTASAGRISPRSTATAATASARPSCSTIVPTRPAPCSSRAISTGPASSAGGVRWFHSGGIFAALSETTSRADHRGDASREGRRGDRSRSTSTTGPSSGRPSAAPAGRNSRCGKIVEQRRRPDRQRRRPAEGPGHHRPGGGHGKSKLDPETFFTHDRSGRRASSQLKIVATTLREVHSTNRHDWAAVLWLDGQRMSARPPARRASTASAAATASPPA